ncbi:hypothetical protein ZOSMA_99G00640 [Zostera marina]|uniref:Uncharacterized protein n=1 Tax=Zostera marina TaxID=29655 RepID=A0A0K9NHP6_ZOSMR|nr:hypothetical protein ZOSMA_99G00640 [Zostera marina]
MPENIHDKCEIVNDIPDDMYPILDLESGFDLLTYDDIQVEGNVTSRPLFEDTLDFDNLFSDPQIKKSLGEEDCSITPMKEGRSVIKCSNSADGCYGLFTDDCGLMNSIEAHGGKPEINFEFSDRIFRGIEVDRNMYLTRDVLGSTSNDFLLDDGSSQKGLFLNYVPIKDSSLEKSQSGCGVQNLENDRSLLAETSKFSKPVIPPHSESKSEQNVSFLDNMNIDELHEVFRSTFGRDTFIDDREWLKRRIMFGLQSTKEMDTSSSITESRSSSNEHDDNSIFCINCDMPPKRLNCGSLSEMNNSEKALPEDHGKEGSTDEKTGMISASDFDTVKSLDLGVKDGELTSKKRLRKPTRRYIEELSEKKPKIFSSQKMESCNKESKDIMELIQSNCDSPILMGSQLFSASGPRRGRPRKNCTLLLRVTKGNKELKPRPFHPSRKASDNFRNFESTLEDDDSMSAASDSSCKISKTGSGGRRKHHRQWTLTEVMKLIEGVSQHGVGRWTEIKRHFFSSSNYRTSVDLKDKWRNLLRATGAHIHGKKKVESSKKQHMSHPIPQSVSRRVRELSTIYPYPRERKSRSQLMGSGTNSTLISTVEMACESSDHGG